MVFEGIWTLVLLTYAHLVYTSASIVNCRELDNEMVSKLLYWLIVLHCFPVCSIGSSMGLFNAMKMHILG